MLAVLLLAAFQRIHDLNAQGLWGDEGWSIWLARGDSLRDLTMTMVADHHGPVYSTLLRAWDGVAGQTVLALRWITVLFSVGSVALIYRLGRAMFTPAAGVGAALALALMDKQTVLAQEVRDYPMVFFTMIAIAYFYVRWIQGASPPAAIDHPRSGPISASGYAFWFVACSIWGLYLHYYCFMVNLAIILHALFALRDRRAWRHFWALNGLIALAFAPWLPIVVHQFVNTPVNSEVLNIHGMPFNRHTLEYLATESFGKPVAIYAMLALMGWIGPLSTRLPGVMMRQPVNRRRAMTLLAVLWFGFPVIITALLHSRYPLLTDRNISVIMPGIALVVGLGLTAFEWNGAAWITALVIVNELFVTSAYYVKPPWREMAADVTARTPAGEPVLLDVEGEHAAAWYEFSLDLPIDLRRIVNLLPVEAEGMDRAVSLYDWRSRYKGDFVPRLQTLLAQIDGVWLAYWGDESKKHDSFDVLAVSGFVRTGTRFYQHHGYPIYAYRYDRSAALQTVIARFGDTITLRRAESSPAARAGDTLSVLLWWGAEGVPPADYTVSVFLLDSGGVLRAQHDGYPGDGLVPTSTWAPGALVFDAHLIDLPESLPSGEYAIGVKLYTWWDGAILPTANGADYQQIGQVVVR
jgi:hypothetical protein